MLQNHLFCTEMTKYAQATEEFLVPLTCVYVCVHADAVLDR